MCNAFIFIHAWNRLKYRKIIMITNYAFMTGIAALLSAISPRSTQIKSTVVPSRSLPVSRYFGPIRICRLKKVRWPISFKIPSPVINRQALVC